MRSNVGWPAIGNEEILQGREGNRVLVLVAARVRLAERYSEVFPMFLNPHPALCTDPVFSSSLLLHFRAAVIAQLGDVNAKVKINAWCVQIGFGADKRFFTI